MLIRERLAEEKFTGAQKSVIDHILACPDDLETMTVRELAAVCYTSNATLIRIAHKLGYRGWEEFRSDFLREQTYLNSHFSSIDPNIPFGPDDLPVSILHKVAELKTQAIRETEALQDPIVLRQAVRQLQQAKQIVILGSNNLALLAQEFALKAGRIQKQVLVSNTRDELAYTREHLRPGTVVIALSYSGETSTLIPFIREASQADIPIIALTSISESTLSKAADCVLPICTREKMYSKIGWYTTEASFSCLLDTLYSLLFWMDYEKNLQFKMDVAHEVEKNRKSSSGILSESDSR